MSDTEQPEEIIVIGPGTLLRQAREKKGLSIQQVATKLHLKAAVIEDIEGDCLDESISVTFSKGYLKLYAKHVAVDEKEIVAAFDNLNIQQKEPAKLQSFSRRVARQASDDRLMLLTYFIVAIVVAMVIWWWFQQSTDSLSSADLTEVSTEQPVIQEPALVTNENSADSIQDTENTIQQNLIEQQPDLSSADLITTDDRSLTAAELPVNGDSTELPIESTETQSIDNSDTENIELIFTFADDCWINITDSTGEAIAYGVKASGRVMTVSGVPPFEVTLGAPQVVQISYDGDMVDLSFLPSNQIAKFNLPRTPQ
jgi:cytoskeleton protein RodZ